MSSSATQTMSSVSAVISSQQPAESKLGSENKGSSAAAPSIAELNARYQETSFETLRRLADEGDAVAQCRLGLFYCSFGQVTSKSAHIAVALFQKAANAGNAEAMHYLGRCYEKGDGITKDTKIAVELFERSAELKYLLSIQTLAEAYEFGTLGLSKDKKRQMEFLQQAVDLNDSSAMNRLALIYSAGVQKDLGRAISLYQKASNLGDNLASVELGRCYRNGTGVDKDLKRAVKLFQVANKGKFEQICSFELGYCYIEDLNLAPSMEEGLKVIRQMAEEGNPSAMFVLGLCYRTGQGVTQDIKRALELIQSSADKGYSDAFIIMGFIYEHGIGVEKDLTRACELYQQHYQYQFTIDAIKKINADNELYQRCPGINPPPPFIPEFSIQTIFSQVVTMLIEGRGGVKDIQLGVAMLQKAASVKGPEGFKKDGTIATRLAALKRDYPKYFEEGSEQKERKEDNTFTPYAAAKAATSAASSTMASSSATVVSTMAGSNTSSASTEADSVSVASSSASVTSTVSDQKPGM